MTQTSIERLHIVEGTDWKDAVIALFETVLPTDHGDTASAKRTRVTPWRSS